MAVKERMDVFTSVHKGLRKALFGLALQAGSTDPGRGEEVARLEARAREVFHFVGHHALNEDRFLVPEMKAKGMAEAEAMEQDHGRLEAELENLGAAAAWLPETPSMLPEFHLALNRFISAYLLHLDQEETRILPALHDRFSDPELASFSRQSVASTPPDDQAMMLSHMFPAMHAGELAAFFGGVRASAPAEAVAYLEDIGRRVLGDRALAAGIPPQNAGGKQGSKP